jgi:hypothetical protein
VRSGNPGEELYIYPPHRYYKTHGNQTDVVWKLRKSTDGTRITLNYSFDTLCEFLLKDYGFKPVNKSATYYTYDSPKGEVIQLVFHANDMMFSFSDDDLGLHFKAALMTQFDATDDGPTANFAGILVQRTEYTTHLSQTPLVEELLKRFQYSKCNTVKTPMDPGSLLTAHAPGEEDDCVDKFEYQTLVGTLLHLSEWTRPDLVFATHQLAKWNHDPHTKHMRAALRVLRYLNGTRHIGITYTRGKPDGNLLLRWADTDWAACTVT